MEGRERTKRFSIKFTRRGRPRKFWIRFSVKEGTDGEVLDQVLGGGRERTKGFSIKFTRREGPTKFWISFSMEGRERTKRFSIKFTRREGPTRFSMRFSLKEGKDEEVLDQVLDGRRGRTGRFWIRFSSRGKTAAVHVQVHDKVNDEVDDKERGLCGVSSS